ncbi:MAG: hypothetical protein VXZ72_05155 [Chlamydiota bacterium]|nr:hypothetical protein [Chlamydiota bacterium]
MFNEDRGTLKRLKSRKVSKGKDRVKDYAMSAGRGALLGASADLLSPYSGKKSLLFPLIGAGALAGAGYEAYKGMKKKAALENFYMYKVAGEDSFFDKIRAGWNASQHYSPKELKQLKTKGYIVRPKRGMKKKAALENFYRVKEASNSPRTKDLGFYFRSFHHR